MIKELEDRVKHLEEEIAKLKNIVKPDHISIGNDKYRIDIQVTAGLAGIWVTENNKNGKGAMLSVCDREGPVVGVRSERCTKGNDICLITDKDKYTGLIQVYTDGVHSFLP
jgi:hypothetical protein